MRKDCRDLASIVVPVQHGPIVNLWAGKISESGCVLDPWHDTSPIQDRTWAAKINTVGLEKGLGKEIVSAQYWSPKMGKIGYNLPGWTSALDWAWGHGWPTKSLSWFGWCGSHEREWGLKPWWKVSKCRWWGSGPGVLRSLRGWRWGSGFRVTRHSKGGNEEEKEEELYPC